MDSILRFFLSFFLLVLISCSATEESNTEENKINWIPFNQQAFDLAQQKNKLIYLNIGANWCHWCHVMDEKTYPQKEVIDLLNQEFITCHADQDLYPELYAAYRNWGWPAIIVFDADKNELLKLKGYQPKDILITKLTDVIENPVPIVETQLNQGIQTYTMDSVYALLDFKQGGYLTAQKSLQREGFRLLLPYINQKNTANWLNRSIQNSIHLNDTVWGGIYQYSTHFDWQHQHYEKLLRVQGDYLDMYASFASLNDSNRWILPYAQAIVDYCDRFLKDKNGLFYSSQNADLVDGIKGTAYYSLNENDRLELGIPSIDSSLFLKENAMFARGLLKLYLVTGNPIYFDKAENILRELLSFHNGNFLFNRTREFNGILTLSDQIHYLESLILYFEISQSNESYNLINSMRQSIMENFIQNDHFLSAIGDLTLPPVQNPSDNLLAIKTLIHAAELCGDNDATEKLISISQLQLGNFERTSVYSKIRYMQLKNQENLPSTITLILNNRQEKSYIPLQEFVLLNSTKYYFKIHFKEEHLNNEANFYNEFPYGTIFECTSSYCSAPFSSQEEFMKEKI